MRSIQSVALALLAVAFVAINATGVSADIIKYFVSGTINVNQDTTDFYSGISVGAPFTGFILYDDAIAGVDIGGDQFDVYQFTHPPLLGVSFTVAGQTFQGDPTGDAYAPQLFDDFKVGPFPSKDTIAYLQSAVPISGHDDTAFLIRAELSAPATMFEFEDGETVHLPSTMQLSDWTNRKAIEFGTLSELGDLRNKLGGTIDVMQQVLPGDYDSDGVVTDVDADLQSAAMKNPSPDLMLFDENNDGLVDYNDRLMWIHDHAGTWVGDSDMNGEFGSGDLVFVFTAGKYETGEAAGWALGDWDGNMLFDSGDFVAAFTDGGYEQGPRATPMIVPEPAGMTLLLAAIGGFFWLLRPSGPRRPIS